MKTKNSKILIGLLALLGAVVILGGAYFLLRDKGQAGAKEITVVTVYADKTTESDTIQTQAAYLGEALLEHKLIEGDMGEYGLFITNVKGVAADGTKNEWWCITKGGEQVNTGADTTPIANGDTFELTLSVY